MKNNMAIDVVITAALRTPIGTINGCFESLSAVDLTVPVMKSLVEKSGVDPAIIEDVIWGENYQRTYKENNLARVAAVKAGLPNSVPGITVHRNCTSSMSALQLGYYQIKAGEADCVLTGGTDSMSNAPHMVFNVRKGVKFGDLQLHDSMWDSLNNTGIGPAMGITAENVGAMYSVSREEQDEYALLSQQRAAKAIAEGKFKAEIIPITVKSRKGETVIDTDEYPRETTLEKLASLKPAFEKDGTVTAGNASGMNDASAGIMLMREDVAHEQNAPVLARVLSTATTGVSPDYMGIGPVSAVQKTLKKAGLTIDDIDLFEINEAFAVQCIACERELKIPREKLNVNGGGISLGHPVGASGARIIVTLLHEMERQNLRYGIAALCAGGGMGTAVLIENLRRKEPLK